MNIKIPFVKYQGTGNDFVIIDQRFDNYIDENDQGLIARICDRRFGVGADGLMLLCPSKEASFRMVYFNADGKESTMCGNGGRCIAHYAHALGIIEKTGGFLAIDGWHDVKINEDEVALKMIEVKDVQEVAGGFVIFTGSPHYVTLVNALPENIEEAGRKIRYAPPYQKEGINVNFVIYDEKTNKAIVATYERGVEAETLSCGTGVTAAALICNLIQGAHAPVTIQTKGGVLSVGFKKTENGFSDVWLSGPAQMVFTGSIKIDS